MTRTTMMMVSLLAGCVNELGGDELTYGEDEQAIQDGTFANTFQIERAARLRSNGCSATQISSDTILTALHCAPAVNDTIFFWTSATQVSSITRTVAQVIIPPGTFILPMGFFDYTDVNGDHADIAVLRLSSPIRSTVATLAWNYPGTSKIGQKVGNGNHEGAIPSGSVLMQRSDYTHGDDDDGSFMTNQYGTNNGDSGGPYYVNAKQVGVLTGGVWDTVMRGLHTSVPHHLDFILDAMDYKWPFGAVDVGVARAGAAIEVLVNRTQRVCRYACNKTTSCEAFTFYDFGFVTQCYLMSSVTATESIASATSASKS